MTIYFQNTNNKKVKRELTIHWDYGVCHLTSPVLALSLSSVRGVSSFVNEHGFHPDHVF
jgi:hypothetical protein